MRGMREDTLRLLCETLRAKRSYAAGFTLSYRGTRRTREMGEIEETKFVVKGRSSLSL
jgi:hypothetical protein